MKTFGPGSQQALRRNNIDMLVQHLEVAGPSTQRELAEGTNLSGATVSNLVKILKAEGRIQTSQTISSGRRATLVQLSE